MRRLAVWLSLENRKGKNGFWSSIKHISIENKMCLISRGGEHALRACGETRSTKKKKARDRRKKSKKLLRKQNAAKRGKPGIERSEDAPHTIKPRWPSAWFQIRERDQWKVARRCGLGVKQLYKKARSNPWGRERLATVWKEPVGG